MTNNPEQQTPIIDIQNLRLKFPGEASLQFKDLSFTAYPGEKILLLGPSGCGKSTLLQVLSGLIPHTIEIPMKYDDIHIPEAWGFVFQDPDSQFCMPYVDEELAFVLENLNIPNDQMTEKIHSILHDVGLDQIDLHTPIDNLSQGMKQRLALASALLLQPDVLFLDEPTALLDPEGTIQIWDSVKTVATNKTVLIVEHKIDQIKNWVDRVVLFNHSGEIIADGYPSHIFKNYQKEIDAYGIWYPEVWKDYIDSQPYQHLITNRLIDQEKHPTNPILTVENFKGYYGKTEKIYVEKAHIYPFSWITIIGDNGAGKSTFLLSLMHLLKTTGKYILNGKITHLNDKKIDPPNELSLVFQNPELQFVTNTIYDEIAFTYTLQNFHQQEIDQKVTQLLEDFQLHMDETRHPYQLSIGQKRRLSVATAFAYEAPILLLDEPTFGQDARNTFMMLEKLEELRQRGTTIVMVTHDMNIVKHFATEVWTIDQGNVIEIDKINQQGVLSV